MALFKPYRTTSSKLNSLSIREGQIIFVTDTQELYFDVSNLDRIRLNSEALTKLAGIAENANNYVLPTASTTLGGVRTTSNVTDLTDYEASPIVNGVVYSKNDPGTKVIVSKTQPSSSDLSHEGDIWVVLE